jgi:hypothetical protein
LHDVPPEGENRAIVDRPHSHWRGDLQDPGLSSDDIEPRATRAKNIESSSRNRARRPFGGPSIGDLGARADARKHVGEIIVPVPGGIGPVADYFGQNVTIRKSRGARVSQGVCNLFER